MDDDRTFFILFGLCGAWVVGVFLVSFLVRRARQKPIFPQIPPGTLYAESLGGGYSEKSLLTRIGGASGCLQVYVAAGYLTVTPFFPFNLMFLPEFYDLEHVIPVGDIIEASARKVLFRHGLRIVYRTPNGGNRALVLWLKNPEALKAAIGKSSASTLVR